MGLFKKVIAFFATSEWYDCTEISGTKHIKGQKIRVLFQGLPIVITLGSDDNRLCLFHERRLKSGGKASCFSFILLDPETFYSGISGFIRLKQGKKLVLGRGAPEQAAIFSYSNKVNSRHLAVTHVGEFLLFKDLHSDAGTTLSVLKDPVQIERFTCRRQKKLYRLREIFGGPIQSLPLPEAQFALDKVNRIMAEEAHRPKNYSGQPGAVVVLPDEITPILMGDLHARLDNLINVLCENHFLESLENGSACLVLLGDIVHSEIDDQMEAMSDSMLMMDFIFRLKIRFPNQIFHIRGNHDSFSPDVSKGGIPQGLLWEKYLVDRRGGHYKEEMDRYYDQLPYVALSKDFVACHASPPSRKVNLNMLVNATENNSLVEQLINNRIKQARYLGGYTRRDVKRFRTGLGLELNFPFIVAHNPLSRTKSFWLNVGNIVNHHIIFSANPDSVGVFTRIGNEISPLLYYTEPLLKTINSLPEMAENDE